MPDDSWAPVGSSSLSQTKTGPASRLVLELEEVVIVVASADEEASAEEEEASRGAISAVSMSVMEPEGDEDIGGGARSRNHLIPGERMRLLTCARFRAARGTTRGGAGRGGEDPVGPGLDQGNLWPAGPGPR